MTGQATAAGRGLVRAKRGTVAGPTRAPGRALINS
jgi:hypothetical protein